MLNRFTKIKNIGRFGDVAPGGRSFGENTIIFGNNGNGKSTLTAILRSLAQNAPKLIKERKTFGTTSQQEVEIIFTTPGSPNQSIVYQADSWNHPFENICFFDTRFIAENIFDGEKLEEDHLSNLYRVVVGKQGRILAEQIEGNGRDLKEMDSEIFRKKQEYLRQPFAQTSPFDEFIELPQDTEIDSKILELERAKEFSSLSGQPTVPEVADWQFGSPREIFTRGKVSIHEQAKASIQSHVREHWSDPDHRIEFLAEGLALAKETHCPFCGQDMTVVNDLVDSYRTFFDEAYRQWQTAVTAEAHHFKDWNMVAELATLETRVGVWRKYLEIDCDTFSEWFASQKEELILLKHKFDEECDKKLVDLEYEVVFDSFDRLQTIRAELIERVAVLNSAIEKYKAGLDTTDIASLNLLLAKAQATKVRWSPPWDEFVTSYLVLKGKREALSKEREEKMRDLAQYSATVFHDYEGKINEVLERLDADFRVTDFNEHADRRRAGAVSCSFGLVFFNEHKVGIEDSGNDSPHFGNTLSQGGKNMLAFAFFLATLWHDPELASRIIVFDDPISSFDIDRRRATAGLLATVTNSTGASPEQVIILTHERGFLERLNHDTTFVSAKYLRLVPRGIVNGCRQSDIADFDVDEYLKPEELKYLEEVDALLQGNEPVGTDAHDKCRQVLERAFRAKYHLELRALPLRSSISDYVTELARQGIYDQAKLEDFQRVAPMLHQPHHSSSMSEESEGDVKHVLRETIRLLKLV